jgi:hypothetical protein
VVNQTDQHHHLAKSHPHSIPHLYSTFFFSTKLNKLLSTILAALASIALYCHEKRGYKNGRWSNRLSSGLYASYSRVPLSVE